MKELQKRCNSVYFFSLIKNFFIQNSGKFIFNETNKELIKVICFFFGRNERLEIEMNFSISKGIMMAGSSGLGKTKVIEAIKNNPLKPIRIFSMQDITEQVMQTGECKININETIFLDDVGSEQTPVNHYGTKIDWFRDFIEDYYLQNKIFNKLIIATNLGGDEIEAKYGYRVRSRLREMMNQITLSGEDKR